MLKCFSQEIAVSDLLSYQAAGTGTYTSSVLNMEQAANVGGFDAVAFVLSLGTVTAGSVITFTVKQNSANSTSAPTPTTITPNYANVQGTEAAQVASEAALTITDSGGASSNKSVVLDVILPQQPYLFVTVVVATANAVVRGVVAYQYRLKNIPAALQSTVVGIGTFSAQS
jgi:hypothetical protein